MISLLIAVNDAVEEYAHVYIYIYAYMISLLST